MAFNDVSQLLYYYNCKETRMSDKLTKLRCLRFKTGRVPRPNINEERTVI